MAQTNESIVLPPLHGELADLWRRMREATGSPDYVLTEYAVTALAQLVEARSRDEMVLRFRKGESPVRLSINAPNGLLVPFSIDPRET
jgi:hypothetical protein